MRLLSRIACRAAISEWFEISLARVTRANSSGSPRGLAPVITLAARR
jgi:hypothetical protein